MDKPGKTRWRLIQYADHDAATNMAIDEAILESHIQGLVPPTVRLYGFKPAAVSIGYAQKLDQEVVARIDAAKLDLVRRPTGGRAVLHMLDLTYSFVGTAYSTRADQLSGAEPSEAFLSSSIVGAYKQICQGLVGALESLGVTTELGVSDASYRQLQDCFLATTTADLHHHGKKLVGSAQLRRGKGVLQHGSLLLNQDQRMMDQLLSGQAGENVDLSECTRIRHANLFEIAGQEIEINTLEAAIKSGFERAFSVELDRDQLSESEKELANRLRAKYICAVSDVDGKVQHIGA